MKPIDLAREVNIPPPTIHRLITGKSTRPYKSSLQPIADYFSMRVEQLVGEEPLQNEKDADIDKNKNLSPSIHYIPLIPWESLHTIFNSEKNVYEKLPFIGEISDNGCATIMQDSSMEPVFAGGSLLIFEPLKLPKDRSYILVQLHDNNLFVFRQLLIDVDHKYLKPLNPDLNAFKMRLLSDEDKIVGTLVEARQIYSES
jgi:SOS-response transcriptional repressor LexA